MKALDAVLWIFAAVFSLIAFVTLIDFMTAIGAQACGTPGAGPNCYPWGAEGPVAGDWHYASKENYIFGGAVVVALAGIVLGTMVLSRPNRSHLARAIAALAAGGAGYILWVL